MSRTKIAIKADQATRSMYTLNIIKQWHQATPDQVARGRSWYQTANQIGYMIADGDAVKGAGVLAALSPMTEWGENVKLASEAFAKGGASGTFGDACRKAARIMSGEDPANVLPMDMKTGHFYRSNINPADPEPVCIDRHAHDIA